MEQISYLGITNTVYKAPFNLNVEIMRYLMIKEKLVINPALKNPHDMIMSAFNYHYEDSGDFKTPKDPFLFTLPSTTRFYKYYETYNSIVNEILEELEEVKKSKESILKTKSLTINIKEFENYILFELKNNIPKTDSSKSFRKFSQKIYKNFSSKGSKVMKYKYQALAALLRYDILGFLGNNSAAEPPEKYEKLKKEGYNVELFGSFYNAYMDRYFGLFYDLEHQFGCLGNLFTAKLHYGKFVCNPPFDIYIMNRLVKFLLENHKNNSLNSKELQVYITVPVWYKEDREKLGKKDTYSENKEFHKELLKPYIIKDEIHLQKDYEFYSYLTGKYRGLCDVNNFVVKL